ncbi:MAG: prepilin-type N-terminal cleavage/methylation domain-containing protein [bacterium]
MKRPRRIFHKKRKGYSLAETLVSIFIITVIVGVLTSTLLVLLRSFVLYTTRNELLTDASRVTEQIGSIARPAYGIEASRVISGTTYTSDATSLILKLASINSAGEPIPSVFDYIVFLRDPNNQSTVLEIVDADPASVRADRSQIIGHNVTDFALTYKQATPVTSSNVYATVTVAKKAGNVTPSFSLHVDAKLRNK